MVLQSDWAQVQVIELRNDGAGFGFGISGSRNSGAVVRNIFPGGAADREGHLRNGDHLLQVGDVRLWGMGAQQVASILRAAGQDCIRLVVARPVDPTDPSQPLNCVVVPTKALADPAELDRALAASLTSGIVAAAGAQGVQPQTVFQAVVGGGVQLPVLVSGPVGQSGASAPTAPAVAHLGSMAVAISASAPVSGTSSLTSIPGTSSLGAVTGIMPIPAVAASFSIPEASVTKSDSNGATKCLDTSALKSCLSEVKMTHSGSVSSSLGRSASLHSRPGHVSRSGDHVTTCPLESGESSTILTRSTCSLHSDTRTTLSQQSLSINSKGGIQVILRCSDDGKTVTVRSKSNEMNKGIEPISDDKKGDDEGDNADEDREDSMVASDTSGSLHMQHNTITRQSFDSSPGGATSIQSSAEVAIVPAEGADTGASDATEGADCCREPAAQTAAVASEPFSQVRHIGMQAALSFSPADNIVSSPGTSCLSGVISLSEGESVDSYEDQRCVFEIEMEKDENGLGLTVAGYICEKESLCGIFVKKVVEGSVADVQGRILPNDQVIEVDGVPLSGYCNQEAVEMLKLTGKKVKLKVCRYMRGLKFEQQQDIGVYRLTAVQDKGFVMTQDTAAHCNMSMSSTNMSPTTATPTPDCQDEYFGVEVRKQIRKGSDISRPDEVIEMKEIVFSRESMLTDLHVEKCRMTVSAGFPGQNNSPLVELTPLPSNASQSSMGPKVNVGDHMLSGRSSRSSQKSNPADLTLIDRVEVVSSEILSENDPESDRTVSLHRNTSLIRHDSVSQPLNQSSKSCDKSISDKTHGAIHNKVVDKSTICGEFLNAELKSKLEHKWQQILGSKYKIIVGCVTKRTIGGGLGISLEGTVDVEDGVEVRPHHYIRSILPQGPVGSTNSFWNGDQLLEVNGIDLTGMFHQDVVKTLQEVGVIVILVCSRRICGPSPLHGTIVNNVETDRSKQAFNTRKILCGSLHSLLEPNDVFPEIPLMKAKSELSLMTSPVLHSDRLSFSSMSRSLEIFSDPATWSTRVEEVTLIKGEKGLGFSILDYQDPHDTNNTVIVVRGLVPGGAAMMDGRIIPGDRVMYVNTIELTGATLDVAVQALKGAALGQVRIGVCKPKNIETSYSYLGQGRGCVSGPSDQSEDTRHSGNLQTDTPTLSQSSSDSHQEISTTPSVLQEVALPVVECRINQSGLNSQVGEDSDVLQQSSSSILPQFEKYTIKILKQPNQLLGMEVEALAWNLSGCLIRELDPEGAVALDGRIKTGDLLVNINQESMWQVTSSQARNILSRADLCRDHIRIVFVPEEYLIEDEEEDLSTPECGDIGTKLGVKHDDTEESDDNHDHACLSDIQEHLEERSGSLCSNSLIFSSPSSLSVSVLPPDLSVHSVASSATLHGATNSRTSSQKVRQSIDLNLLDQLPESRVDLSPDRDLTPELLLSPEDLTSSPTEFATLVKESPKTAEELPKTANHFATSTRNLPSPHESLPTPTKNLPILSSQTIDLPLPIKLQSSPTETVPTLCKDLSSPSELLESPTEVLSSPIRDFLTSSKEGGVEERTGSHTSPVTAAKTISSSETDNINTHKEILVDERSKIIEDVSDVDVEEPDRKVIDKYHDAVLSDTKDLNIDLVKPYEQKKRILQDQNKHSLDEMQSPSNKFWGPKRLVEVYREPNQALGIAIVGGKVDMTAGRDGGVVGGVADTVTGIFIKNVLADSPAGRTCQLATGDRIVEVNGVYLSSADHELAVEAIQSSGNPLRFIVQSLQHWPPKDGNEQTSSSRKMSGTRPGGPEHGKVPSKLIIPDIFCPGGGNTANGPTSSYNGIPSSTTRSDSSRVSGSGLHIEPDFNERRHSESVVKSRNSQLGNIGRPKSENHGSQGDILTSGSRRSSSGNKKPGLNGNNGNPFQDDQTQVWQPRNSSNLSSPEGNVEPQYHYNYKRVTDGPRTPERHRGPHSPKGLHDGGGVGQDYNSYMSTASGYSSNPSSPILIQKGLSDNQRQMIFNNIDAAQNELNKPKKNVENIRSKQKSIDDDAHDNIEEIVVAGDNIFTAGSKRRSNASINNNRKDSIPDDEDEDEEGIKKLDGDLITVSLEQNNYGLGISLAGHKDRETMRTFICGLHPRGSAGQSGQLMVGDLLVKVGEVTVWDRCHLNVTSIIKNMSSIDKIDITVLRNKKYMGDLSVKPVTHYPLLLDDMIFESEEFSKFSAKRELRVHKGKAGLGIMIIEGSHKATGNGIFVSDIQEKSAAFHSGLKVGDMILAINTETFLGINYDEAVSIIKSLGGNVKMLVTSPREEENIKTGCGPESKPALQPRREEPSGAGPVKTSPAANKTKTSEQNTSQGQSKSETKTEEKPKIKEDDCKVELVKDSSGIGLSIVGGTDTPMIGVFIQEIYPGGPADKSGKLKTRDRIMKLNDVDFTKVTHTQALEAIRGSQDKVTLIWERGGDDDKPSSSQHQDINVTLVRKPGKGLGLSVVGRRDGPGVYISALVPGGVAEGVGQLHHGDQIIKVNERDLSNSTQDAAVACLKMAVGDIKLVVRRMKILTK